MEKAITNDHALKQAIENYPIARLISENIIEQEVRGILTEQQSDEPARRGKYGPWVITITLIAALAVSYYHWNRYSSQAKIYAAVMKSYSPPINKSTRGIESSNDKVQSAIKAFDLRDFKTSYDILKAIKPKSDSIYWYLGHIALISGNVYEAKLHSKKISDEEMRADILQYVDRIIRIR